MKFCPKCGALLLPRKDSKGIVNACTSCKYVDKAGSAQTKISERNLTKKEIQVVSDDSDDISLPLTDAKCEQCNHTKAYYWLVQTRAADEPETKFLKCEKCKHTWRDYS
jgi:transcription factor S